MKKTLFVSISIVLLSAVCFSAKHGAEKTKAASVSAEEAQRVMELPNSIASLYGVEGVYVLVEDLHEDVACHLERHPKQGIYSNASLPFWGCQPQLGM